MRYSLLLLMCIIAVLIFGCSGGVREPVAPLIKTQNQNSEFQITNASDVLYVNGSEQAYKAFGIFQVILDPKSLTAEIVPSRKSQAIGMTFDSDLTQFLTVSPCENCLQIDGIRLIPPDQVEVGFAVKHPFADIVKRPDLHGFDVRGIVLAKGNYNFPLTQVAMDASTGAAARANVSLLDNPDGYMHHFDELATDPHYFDPPRNYDANINPFRSYFVDGGTPAFNPNDPLGHNVMKVGADWETQNYIFNLSGSLDPIDFAFVVDCAYGQSATFQNRTSPYYFLPEFNRKEAWSVVVNDVGGRFESGNTSSSMDYRVSACDWQSGLDADPDYPNTSNLGGIKAKSQIQKVTIEIPAVSGLVEKTVPDSGEGFIWNPYIFNITVTNSEGAASGWYYGIAAVRDDLQGQRGPIAIPETPLGFPYAGPEIYDYSTYATFKVRVYGSIPNITGYSTPGYLLEGDYYNFTIDIDEPDGDTMTYHWEQVSPSTPIGLFVNPDVEDPTWQAPPLYDVPVTGVDFSVRVAVTDDDGMITLTIPFKVFEKNIEPQCQNVHTDPFYGVIDKYDTMDLWISAFDPEGDVLNYEWDLDWDGDPMNFDIESTGLSVFDYNWPEQGFYTAACRITEERTNPLISYCTRTVIQEGMDNTTIKVDDSDAADPGYFQQDVCMVRDVMNNPIYHVAYIDYDDKPVFYCNNIGNQRKFSNHQSLSRGPSLGSTGYAKIAGAGNIIHVIWIEYDSSVSPASYKIKIDTSLDGGMNFEGERTVVSSNDPDFITTADIYAGTEPQHFFMVFGVRSSGNYYCYFIFSDDGGLSWNYPISGGQFKSVSNNQWAGDFTLKVSNDGIIHVCWQDYRTGTSNYFYDWSTDSGETWNTELQVNASPNPSCGSMVIDGYNNARFAWIDTNGVAYFAKSYWGNPPSLSGQMGFFNSGAGNLRGIDIFTSMNGATLIIPVMYYLTDHYETRYFQTFDAGWHINMYWTRIFDPAITVNDIVCDGRWEADPSRIEIFAAWVDTRTSLAPLNDHIWGEFVYLAERF